jgi:hypothetical protein
VDSDKAKIRKLQKVLRVVVKIGRAGGCPYRASDFDDTVCPYNICGCKSSKHYEWGDYCWEELIKKLKGKRIAVAPYVKWDA